MSSDLGEEGQNIILYRLYFTVLLASGTMSSCVVSAKEPRERVNGMSFVCDVCASSSYYSECQCEPALIFVGVPLSEKPISISLSEAPQSFTPYSDWKYGHLTERTFCVSLQRLAE